jgi:hypothetical protein
MSLCASNWKSNSASLRKWRPLDNWLVALRTTNLDLNEVVANMTRMLQRILGEDTLPENCYKRFAIVSNGAATERTYLQTRQLLLKEKGS